MRPSHSLVLGLLLLLANAEAATINLISNGDFELGTTTGWTSSLNRGGDLDGSCNDGFAAQLSASGCVTGIGPQSGQYAAYSSTLFPDIANQIGYYQNGLSQSFVVPSGTIANAQLAWQDSAVIGGAGESDGVFLEVFIFAPNQINPVASQVAIAPPSPSGSVTFEWTSNLLDVTSLLNSYRGQSMRLELYSAALLQAPTNPALSINSGFDNVSLNVTTEASSTPEPRTLLLAGAGLVGIATVVVRRTSLAST